MRFHLIGLHHTVSSHEMLSCAFTQKVVKFAQMMKSDSKIKKSLSPKEIMHHKTIHELIHYGHERSDIDVDEHVTVMTDNIWKALWGDYDWKIKGPNFHPGDPVHKIFILNCITEINKRYREHDFILCFWGIYHKDINDHFQDKCFCIEPGIGYLPNMSANSMFKIYESYAIMHLSYGLCDVIHPYTHDSVIPNYFNPDDFIFQKKKKNYFLYLGRLDHEKGLHIVVDLAKIVGFHLIIAGQGSLEPFLQKIPSNIEYIGFVDIDKRKTLLANAKALILPTVYIEPFGGVTMEAMMSGTPVITCDWGVFTETVVHGVTGYRCRTMDHYVWAIQNIHKINPSACRTWAMNYSLEKVRSMYEEYFDMVLKTRSGRGFYQENYSRTELNWLKKSYPFKEFTQVKSKPRIAFITETKWAFGRIANGLCKYSDKFIIDVFDWENRLNIERLEKYDLIYATLWHYAQQFIDHHPQFKNKTIFTAHAPIDFTPRNHVNGKTFAHYEDVAAMKISNHAFNFIKDCNLPMSSVSHEMMSALKDISKVYLTQCGIDSEIFKPKFKENERLKVIFTFPEVDYRTRPEHTYEQKRKYLAMQIKDKIKDLPIDLIFTSDFLPLSKMPEFYDQGDVFLSTSHSEGTQLSAMEAGASGLIIISPEIAEIPFFVEDGENGFLLENGHEDKLVDDIIEKLKLLADDKDLLRAMKIRMAEMMQDWYWENKVEQWEDFFEKSLEISRGLI